MNIFEIILAFFLFIIDRIMKYRAIHIKSNYEIFSWFSIKGNYFNTGFSLSMLSGNKLVLYIATITFLLFFFWLLCTIIKKRYIFGSYLIFFGGVSNIFDRLWYGGVIDYLHCHCFNLPLPVFNIADVMIVVGVSFALFSIMHTTNRR